MPSKTRTKYVCQACGHESVKWLGKCPGCGEWNTMVEEVDASRSRPGPKATSSPLSNAVSIKDVPTAVDVRFSSRIPEFDRLLGGGIVPGSLLLIGGDPGIGKSTLLLQISTELADADDKRTVLYVSGEESVRQIRLRAERLGALADSMLVLAETDLERVEEVVARIEPGFIIIDSIQTMFLQEISSAPGSVSQIRECTARLLRIAKGLGIATCIVGHVTKEGNLAGPRLLEHMVDAVLYFEGDRHHTYRILRAVKNRFGSTNELAIFEMRNEGLLPVANPSEMFLSERHEAVPGSAVVATLEGTRPLLLEVQALVAPTSFGTPRRMASGADYNRMSLLLAVLERRLGMHVQNFDAYVNVAGGVRVDEPAIDLGMALSLASSFRDVSLRPGDVYIGEVGLTGEVRSVPRTEQRIREAAKLGFSRCVVPSHGAKGIRDQLGIEVIGVHSLAEAVDVAFAR